MNEYNLIWLKYKRCRCAKELQTVIESFNKHLFVAIKWREREKRRNETFVGIHKISWVHISLWLQIVRLYDLYIRVSFHPSFPPPTCFFLVSF